jgi:alpha-tubulin suppressor-like RCC1 family protein
VARIQLSAVDGFVLNPDQTTRLVVTLLDSANHVLTGRAIAFTSTNTNVATITEDGIVTAIVVGRTTVSAKSGDALATATVYVVGPPPMQFVQIEVGSSQTCALTGDGSIYCWLNRLTNGRTQGNPRFVASTVTFQSLSVGVSHACALSIDGAAYCWGDNGDGQLGTGDTLASPTPLPVAGSLAFQSVSAGYNSTCALTAGGDVYCWGDNSPGAGVGPTSSYTAPTRVVSSEPFASVSVGSGSTCGVTVTGNTLCWGTNRLGQLGNGTTTSSATPAVVTAPVRFREVSVGEQIACGLTTTDLAYCWGSNLAGGLGIGTGDTLPHPVPTAVPGGLTWRTLSTGGYNSPAGATCGIAMSGTTYCWGSNWIDLLANGRPIMQSSVPAVAANGMVFQWVSARGDHVCALTATGQVFCWGGYAS